MALGSCGSLARTRISRTEGQCQATCNNERQEYCPTCLTNFAASNHDWGYPKRKVTAQPALILVTKSTVSVRLSLIALRKCTGQEDRSILPGGAALAYQKDDVLTALEARLDASEIVLAVHRLLVDFQNDVAARQVHVFRE